MPNRSGFNADERAAEREAGPVVIGEVTYHPRKLTNKRLRQVRGISRTANKLAREQAKASDEYKEALAEAQASPDEATRKAAEDIALMEGLMCDEVDRTNEEAIVEQLQQLLVDDNGHPISTEAARQHVENDLDSRDQVELMQYLLGPDPTPETATATTGTT